jgi:acyl-CoA synthetase (AMP-forming)/AMP-acid ligase II/acyl carrier protein
MKTNRSNTTILDALCLRAAALPDRPAYHLLSDEGAETGQLTWSGLDRRARALGAHLDARKARGERAILLYPSGLDYIAGLYACLYAGVVAVPAYPPRVNRHISRILSIVEDCAPRYVLTHSSVIAGIGAVLSNFPTLRKLQWIATDTLDLAEDSEWTPAPPPADSLAFLQYTSGSTATPKGVIVTHANLLRNLDLIGNGFGVDDQSVIVSWLPMYHDMGLIGNILATGWLGSQCYVMSPAAFVRRPAVWLQAISRFGATASGGPSFAYDLCVQKVSEEDCAGLDLSSWRTAFNGAEPIRAETMRRFAAKFQRHGFRSAAFFPCYGLAEATLFVAGGRGFDQAGSSGRAHVDRVAVVDPSSRRECAPGAVGEIWVSDASVAGGYWGRPAASAETFGARLASTDEGPFLRTGDLGVMRDGQLSVLGRIKDLIIIRGRNLYPHDIEATAEAATAALCPRGAVAFGVERDREERLVIVAEVAREHRSRLDVEEVGEAVCRAIAGEHGVSPFEIVFIRPASTLRTSSGKLQRNATRDAYHEDALDVMAVWRSVAETKEHVGAHGDLQSWLASVVGTKLKVPSSRLDLHRPISEYGLDSLIAAELISLIEDKLGIELPFELLFVGDPSLAALAVALAKRQHGHAPLVRTPIPLLAMPHAQGAAL